MIRHTYSGKMQVLGLTLIGLLALGVFLGSRAEALLDVVQIIARESSSSTEPNLSAVHPADRKFISGNYGAANAERVSATVSGADRKLLDPGYMRIVRERMSVDRAIDTDSLHRADRKLRDLGYMASVAGQQVDSRGQQAVHPADRKFFMDVLRPAGTGNVYDPLADIHPADRKFRNPGYAGGQVASGDE